MNSQVEPSGRIALFLHWAKNDKISAGDERYILELEKQFDYVLIVKNVNRNIPTKINIEFDRINRVVLSRQNQGYDFGGFQAGIEYLFAYRNQIDEILFCNNSVSLILESLEQTLKSVRSVDSSVTSATNSNEFMPHLQSYFLHFAMDVTQDFRFWKYWSELNTVNDKLQTVMTMEIELAAYFTNLGYDCSAIWSLDRLVSFAQSPAGFALFSSRSKQTSWHKQYSRINSGKDFNLTHKMWMQLLELGFPFIKKDLRKQVGAKDASFEEWEKYSPSKRITQEVLSSFTR